MRKVKIQSNDLKCEQRPTTQEDNFGGIQDRWDLYLTYINDEQKSVDQKIGNLVKYMNRDYAMFMGHIRIDLRWDAVVFEPAKPIKVDLSKIPVEKFTHDVLIREPERRYIMMFKYRNSNWCYGLPIKTMYLGTMEMCLKSIEKSMEENNVQMIPCEYKIAMICTPAESYVDMLDANLQTFQYWQNGIMITAQMSRKDAVAGILSGKYFVISSQAVGLIINPN